MGPGEAVEILVRPARSVVGELVNLLPIGWQDGERNQKPECTNGMAQAVYDVFVAAFANHDVLLSRVL